MNQIQTNIANIQLGLMKHCSKCAAVKSLDEFKNNKLISGYGRICNKCKKHKSDFIKLDKPIPVWAPNTKCPLCASSMIIRERRADKVKFYGCSRFPRCRGIRHME